MTAFPPAPLRRNDRAVRLFSAELPPDALEPRPEVFQTQRKLVRPKGTARFEKLHGFRTQAFRLQQIARAVLEMFGELTTGIVAQWADELDSLADNETLAHSLRAVGHLVAASVAYNYTAETRPDFVAHIYLAHDLVIQGDGVRGDAPPLFVVAATDDHFGLAPQSVAIYQAWVAAKKPAELHLYAKGGHGFGMNKQDLPCDTWADRFADWLQMPGLLEK